MTLLSGPYSVHHEKGADDVDYAWSIIYRDTTIVEGILGEALANLIAAAPELLAAAELGLALATGWVRVGDAEIEPIRAAIAKARGQS